MKIELKKFGTVLMSRPDGREAFLVIRSYFKPENLDSKIILDFTDVEVIAPSWLDEVLTPLKELYGKDKLEIIPGKSATLAGCLEIIEY